MSRLGAAFYVEDALGDKFLFTVADLEYEPAFRKHARWWIKYVGKKGASQEGYRDSRGNRLNTPVRPVRIVVEPR